MKRTEVPSSTFDTMAGFHRDKQKVTWKIAHELLEVINRVKIDHALSRNEDAVEWMLWEFLKFANYAPAGGIVTQNEVQAMRIDLAEVKTRLKDMEKMVNYTPVQSKAPPIEFHIEELMQMSIDSLQWLAKKLGISGRVKGRIIENMKKSEYIVVVIPGKSKQPELEDEEEEKSEGRKYICGNCGKDGHSQAHCTSPCALCNGKDHTVNKCTNDETEEEEVEIEDDDEFDEDPEQCEICQGWHVGECRQGEGQLPGPDED